MSIRSGETHKALASKLFEAFDISKKRAVVIARDQINKLNGNLTKARNLELGITEFKWSTSVDDRVRRSHAVLQGRICSWHDSTIVKPTESGITDINFNKWLKRTSLNATIYQPGEDIQCRCSSIPILNI
jgi:SPP1 gp7 family putative phage head morphogenesis protein